MLAHDMILRPIITERSMSGMAMKKYTFKVAKEANKIQIRNAIEEIFGVEVAKVWTMNVRGRMRRRGKTVGFTPSWKKAIVKLKENSKGIEFFDTIV